MYIVHIKYKNIIINVKKTYLQLRFFKQQKYFFNIPYAIDLMKLKIIF